jgi:hypothetical protein
VSDIVKDRFIALSKELGDKPLLDLGREYALADQQLDSIKELKALAEARVEWLRLNIAKRCADDKVPSFAVVLGEGEKATTFRIRSQDELFVSAPSESGVAEKVIAIMKLVGNGAMVKETIAPGTLKKHVGTILKKQAETKEITDEYKQLLDAGLKVTITPMARFY